MANTDRITVPSIVERKRSTIPAKITALTAYDFTMARLLDRAGVDILLVGDSLGCVVQGHTTTLPVTLDEMIYHSKCVSRAAERALVVGDLPFLSYQISIEQALLSAGRLVKEGGIAAVKLEGGVQVAETIARIVSMDIPVMGHVGLTPQSFHRMGGNKVQGRKAGELAGSRNRIIRDAKAVQDAGAFSIVLESIPQELAEEITKTLDIPTIGIGAGVNCDGQILVSSDMLGMNSDFNPRFVKRFANLDQEIIEAVANFSKQVNAGEFPEAKHSYSGEERVKKSAPSLRLAPRKA